MGFEAIWAGHRPVVFGQPFYAGWGLSRDKQPIDRRGRALTVEQLFAGAMILYPKWYDPCRDTLCSLEKVLDQLEAETRAWREDHAGWEAQGISLWKRRPLQQFLAATARCGSPQNAAPIDPQWFGVPAHMPMGCSSSKMGF